jgi:hypothetical protein
MSTQTAFERLGHQFLDLFEFVTACREFDITRLAVPMMTIICNTNLDLDVDVVHTKCQEDDTFELQTASIAKGRTIMLKHANSPISLQVFSGGRLQLAGCTSHIDAILVVEFFLRVMGMEDAMDSTQFNVKLLNVTCTLAGTQLRISDPGFLRDINGALARVRPLGHMHRAEKREHYSACVMYMSRPDTEYRLSCRMFSSGCISITGRCPSDTIYVLKFVVNFFHSHRAHTYDPNKFDDLLSDRRDFRSFQSLLGVFNGGRRVITHTHPPVRHLVDDCRYCQEHGNVYCSEDNA